MLINQLMDTWAIEMAIVLIATEMAQSFSHGHHLHPHYLTHEAIILSMTA